MVGLSIISQLPEGQDMVRRDPKLRDTFPELGKRDIATDADRQMYALPSHVRLNIPLCLSIEELRDWSERLYTLAQDVKVIAASEHNEIWKLQRVRMEVNALNEESKPAIRENRRRFYERKAVEK